MNDKTEEPEIEKANEIAIKMNECSKTCNGFVLSLAIGILLGNRAPTVDDVPVALKVIEPVAKITAQKVFDKAIKLAEERQI